MVTEVATPHVVQILWMIQLSTTRSTRRRIVIMSCRSGEGSVKESYAWSGSGVSRSLSVGVLMDSAHGATRGVGE